MKYLKPWSGVFPAVTTQFAEDVIARVRAAADNRPRLSHAVG